MEQPCYKCGHIVEEGVAFCPHCSAPQIRVVLSEPAREAVLAAQAGSVEIPIDPPRPQVILSMGWSAAFRSCVLAAAVASLLMTLGLNAFVAMFSVGLLAVLFYRQRWSAAAITVGTGTKLGALSGLLCFAISAILGALYVLLAHKGGEMRDEVLKRLNQAAQQTTDPQALAMLDRFKTPGGLEMLMIMGLLFALVTAIVLGAIGGALGGSVFGRREKN